MAHVYAKTPHGRSWHIVDSVDTGKALCGWRVFGERVGVLPAEKSCERCLRIAERAR